ncbi:MAG: DUF1700 domain-containing protein [Gammaproteobacteria bacterium]|nr:DUF1700 domain-containing protein [Gammaproteobacteria bacterium]
MKRDQFLSELRAGLRGLPAQEIADILGDHESHFTEAQAAGRGDDEVADALGDPRRLAKELRAETGYRRWQERRTPGNYFGAVVALCGMAAIDVMVVLPLMCVLVFVAFVIGIALLAVTVAGLGLLASPFWVAPFAGSIHMASIILAGIGLVAGGIGWGALLLLAMDGVLILLNKYARLHYQVIKPADGTA